MGASTKQSTTFVIRSNFSVSLVLTEIKCHDIGGNSFWLRYTVFITSICEKTPDQNLVGIVIGHVSVDIDIFIGQTIKCS